MRRQAEQSLRTTAADADEPPIEDTAKLLHELRVHQEELEIQNEELRRAQRELAGSRDEYLHLYDFAPVGYLGLDRAGVVRAVNLTGADLLGVARADLLGRPISSHVAPPDRETFSMHVQAAFREGERQTCEIELVGKDGTPRHVQLQSIALQDSDAEPRHCQTAVIDITERKRLEEELRRHQGRLEALVRERTDSLVQANGQLKQEIEDRERAEEEKLTLERQVQHAQKLESLGVLAGGIAHDFNNILTAVLGHADLALEYLSETHPARSNVREIENGAKRAADLTRQMLAYSGKGMFVIAAMDVSVLMDEMAHLLRTSIPRTIALNLHLESSLPPIEADAAQMQQIVVNLITNAAEAIGDETGAIALSTGRMACTREYLARSLIVPASPDKAPPPGVYAYFEVSDTGCGMDEETRARIFEPFFTTKFTGRGLGMAVVLGIVRGHKGAIVLDTVPGKGTTFRVLFPAVEGIHADADEGRREASETEDRTGRGTVLVVDDEEAVRNLAIEILERRGFTALGAADGRDGVEVFREHADEIDCVLLDLTMPHMGGEACFEALRGIKGDVKVILTSGYSEQEVARHFAGKGLAGFIQKPYQSAALGEKVRGVMGEGPHPPV